MDRWGYLDSDGNSADGGFPALLLAKTNSIMPREAYGCDKYVEFCPPNVHLIGDCDNKPFVTAFQKGRSDDLYVNSILKNIYETCYLKNIKLELYWIDTQAMIEKGTDGLSRLDYSILEDKETLNLAGVERFLQIYGKAPSCDVFSSIANNPFNIPYCSKHRAYTDPEFLNMDGIEYLTSDLPGKHCDSSYLYIWPPGPLLPWVMNALLHLPQYGNFSCVIVLPSNKVSLYYQSFSHHQNLHLFVLQRPGRASKLVKCKSRAGLTCMGFGQQANPNFDYRTQTASVELLKRITNVVAEESSSKRAKM